MYEHIPQKLKDEALFCVWKRVISKNKVQKKPFQTNGIGASHSNPKHFADFQTAYEVSANDYDGIGIGVFNGISAVDIDNCVVDGVLTPKVQKVVDMMDSYSEISPSETGIRIVFTASDFQFDKNRYYIHNSKEKMEIYVCGATNKFLTITGNNINDKDIEEREQQLKKVLEEFMARPAAKKSVNNILAPGSFLSDEEVIMKASNSNQGEKFTTLWNGDISSYHNDHSRADNALLCILAFWCGGDCEQMKRPFEQSALYREEKWEQLHGAKSYADMSIDTALSQTDKFYQPDYYKDKAADDFNFILEKLKELHPESNGRYKWTEIGAGRLFADIFKGIARFVPERKKWYFYDGKRWVVDIGSLKIMELCKEFADATLKYSKSMEDGYWSSAFEAYCEKRQKRGQRINLINDAESVYPISMTEFDNNRLLFNCDNGTIELQPFCFREHRPEESENPYAWQSRTVADILNHMEYIGHTVKFKNYKKSYKSKKKLRNDPSKWQTFENTHEAIIDQETFDIVQRIRDGRRRRTPMGEMPILSGMVFCADCGAKMYQVRAKGWTHDKEHFVCATYRKKGKELCCSHQIRNVVIEEILISQLKEVTAYARDHESNFVQMITKSSAKAAEKEIRDSRKEYEQAKARISNWIPSYKDFMKITSRGKSVMSVS